MKTPNVFEMLSSLKARATKQSPAILAGVGIAGMFFTVVTAVRATPKALTLIDEKKQELHVHSLTPAETVQATWKCYIPSAVTGAISTACLIGGTSINFKRNAALATAYALSESTLKEYQKKVVETIGEKKEQGVRDAVAKERIEKNPISTKEVVITEKGDTLCLDYLSGRYFKSDREKINRAINDLNRRMLDEMYVSLNDYYYEMGLGSIGVGDELGWNIDNGLIEPDFSCQLTEDGTPCLVISYLVAPRYDYR